MVTLKHGTQEVAMFSLSEWLMRRRIGAQVRSAGSRVEHRRVANPYHAVSIETGPRSCAKAREMEGRRYLSASAPMLPLAGCTSPVCQCRYAHHQDRRIPRDRRVNFANPHAHRMADRRSGTGRRISD
jgi:hypothetical protein